MLFTNFSRKAPGLLFIFIHRITGHTYFWSDEASVSLEPERPSPVFLSFRTSEDSSKKAGL